MSGPAIRHDDLFDFPAYLKGIEEVELSTVEFTKTIAKATATLSVGFDAAKKSLNDYKKIAENAKDVDSIGKLGKSIEEAADKYTYLNDAIKGNEVILVKAKDSIKLMNDEAKKLKSQYESLTEEQRKSEEVGGKIIKTLAQQKVATKEYNDQLKAATIALTTADNSYSELNNELNKLRNELKNMPNAFNASTGAINEQNKEAVELSKRISQVDVAIKQMDKTMGQFGRNVGNYESATVSLKEELRNLTQEIAKMKLEGKENDDIYQKLIERAGELKDTLGDVSAEIKRVGSDTRTIEGMVGVMEGVAGAAAIAEGAMQLFGNENEFVTESIKKLAAMQVLLSGVQAIGNMIQKESAAVVLVVNAQRKLEILYTNLQAAAESKNIIVRKAATATQWLLNKAMSANPVGILITAVALLAGAVLLLSRKTKDQTEEQIKLNEAQKAWIELQKETIVYLNRTMAAKVKDKEETLRLNKEQGYSNEALAKGERDLMDAKLDLAESNYNLAKSSFEDSQFFKDKNIKSLKDLEEANYNAAQAVRNARELLAKKAVKDNYVKEKETEAEVIKAQYENLKGYYEDYENTKAQYREYLARQEKVERENQLKSESAYIDARVILAKDGSKAEYEAQRAQIIESRKLALDNVNLTEGEKYKIKVEANEKLIKLDKDYNFRVKSEAINAEISIVNSKLSAAKAGSDEEYSLKKELFEKQYNLEALSVNNSVLSEEEKSAKLKEIYAKMLYDKQELEKQKRLAELDRGNADLTGKDNLEVLRNQQIIASNKSTYDQVIGAKKRIDQITQDSITREMDLNNQKYTEGLISEDEYQKRKTELLIEQEEERLKIIEEAAEKEAQVRQSVFDLVNQGVSAGFELFKANSDAKIEKLQAEKDAAITAAGENADAKARIEAAYNKKIAAEKRKAAVLDKVGAIFQIGISTAMGVMNALSKPLITGWMVPYIIAMGAMQAALVAAKPIPKYRYGVKNAPEGLAVVNDEPGPVYREIILRGNRAFAPTKRNQMVYLQKGDSVIRAAEARGVLANIGKIGTSREQALNYQLSGELNEGRRMEVEHIMTSALMNSKVSEKAIGDEVGRHLSALPIHQTTWDERGVKRNIRRGNTTVNYLNERNSL